MVLNKKELLTLLLTKEEILFKAYTIEMILNRNTLPLMLTKTRLMEEDLFTSLIFITRKIVLIILKRVYSEMAQDLQLLLIMIMTHLHQIQHTTKVIMINQIMYSWLNLCLKEDQLEEKVKQKLIKLT